MSRQKRGKIYYSRLRVPSDLRLVMDKTELKKWGGDYSDQLILSHADREPDEISSELLSKVIEAHIKEHTQLSSTLKQSANG